MFLHMFFPFQFPDREFLLRVSYMEIYNETITDLVCDTQKMKPLIVREDFNVSNRAEVAKNRLAYWDYCS